MGVEVGQGNAGENFTVGNVHDCARRRDALKFVHCCAELTAQDMLEAYVYGELDFLTLIEEFIEASFYAGEPL